MVAAVRGGAYKAAANPRARAASRGKSRAAPSKFHSGAPGLPPRLALGIAAGVVVVALGVALFTGHRLEAAGQTLQQGMANSMGSLGFRLNSLQIKGASPMASVDIAAATDLAKGDAILGVDLEALREKVSAVGWVKEARVVRLLPSTILIDVKSREPAAVWQTNGVMRVVDSRGGVIPEADPSRFPDLPLLVGEGANDAGETVIDLVRARPRLVERLEALVRVDQRRWDLRLKDGAIIQLPAVDEESALIQLDKLDQSQRLLELGFERIDLRSPEMVVVRRRDNATPGQIPTGTL
jgi:cell division protein FtsQ